MYAGKLGGKGIFRRVSEIKKSRNFIPDISNEQILYIDLMEIQYQIFSWPAPARPLCLGRFVPIGRNNFFLYEFFFLPPSAV